MKLEDCPVSLIELKHQLRRPLCSDDMDQALILCLLASAEYVESFSGRPFSDFREGEFPNALKQAILMRAASYFENPSDAVTERTTASDILANPRIWRKEETIE